MYCMRAHLETAISKFTECTFNAVLTFISKSCSKLYTFIWSFVSLWNSSLEKWLKQLASIICSFPLNSKHGRFILNCLHDRTASLSFRKKTSGITLATSAARATERYRSRMREKSFAMLVSLSLFLSLSFGPESGKVLEEERRRVVLTKNEDDCWRGEVEDESPKGDIEKEGRGKRSS